VSTDDEKEPFSKRFVNFLRGLGLIVVLGVAGIAGGFVQLNSNWDWFQNAPVCEFGHPDVNLGAAIMINFGSHTCPVQP